MGYRKKILILASWVVGIFSLFCMVLLMILIGEFIGIDIIIDLKYPVIFVDSQGDYQEKDTAMSTGAICLCILCILGSAKMGELFYNMSCGIPQDKITYDDKLFVFSFLFFGIIDIVIYSLMFDLFRHKIYWYLYLVIEIALIYFTYQMYQKMKRKNKDNKVIESN